MKRGKLALICFILIIAIISLNFLKPAPTGAIVLEKTSFAPNEQIKGKFILTLKEGEFLPGNATVIITLDNSTKELTLKEWLELNNLSLQEGNFFVQGKNISGFGLGYGWPGSKVVYPEISFRLNLTNNYTKTIEGNCTAQEPFVYELENETAQLILGSVKAENQSLNDNNITILAENNKLKVTTNYTKTKTGFGEDYLQNESHNLSLTLSPLELKATQSGSKKLEISLLYENLLLYASEAKVVIEPKENNPPVLIKPIPNQTIQTNKNKSLNLLDYFQDEDQDSLNFSASAANNLTVLIENSLAIIIPDKDFTGNRSLIFYASDGLATAESNEVVIFVQKANATINCSAGCLYVQDKEGNTIAVFDREGNLALKGELIFELGRPDKNDFVFQDKNKTVVAWIDDVTGNMRIAGNITENTQAYCEPSKGSFVIEDKEKRCVAYIDEKGNLWLRGTLLRL